MNDSFGKPKTFWDRFGAISWLVIWKWFGFYVVISFFVAISHLIFLEIRLYEKYNLIIALLFIHIPLFVIFRFISINNATINGIKLINYFVFFCFAIATSILWLLQNIIDPDLFIVTKTLLANTYFLIIQGYFMTSKLESKNKAIINHIARKFEMKQTDINKKKTNETKLRR